MKMLVNADFARRVCVRPEDYQWIRSPQSGVERIMLDRIGEEKARATSLVRYQPGSSFPAHQHPGGEEILVISGTFNEGEKHYPAGFYMRNPDGSSHAPSSREGTTIFVKLRQMNPGDDEYVRIDTTESRNWHHEKGRSVCPLYQSASEEVSLQQIDAGERLFCHALTGGAELLILDGELTEGDERYITGSWLRMPSGEFPNLISGANGVKFYLKVGHLHAETLAGVVV